MVHIPKSGTFAWQMEMICNWLILLPTSTLTPQLLPLSTLNLFSYLFSSDCLFQFIKERLCDSWKHRLESDHLGWKYDSILEDNSSCVSHISTHPFSRGTNGLHSGLSFQSCCIACISFSFLFLSFFFLLLHHLAYVSFPTRDWTWIHGTESLSLIHRTTRETPMSVFMASKTPLNEWYPVWFIYSPVDGHSCCFQLRLLWVELRAFVCKCLCG